MTSTKKIDDFYQLYLECGQDLELACQKAGGLKLDSGRRYLSDYKKRHGGDVKEDECEVDINEQAGTGSVVTKSTKIKTVEQALEYAEIDLDYWEAYRCKTNHWDVTMKGNDGLPIKRTNYQIAVWLQRKKQDPVGNGMKLFIEQIKENAPTIILPNRSKVENPHLIEISIFDHHFGKLCWGRETTTDWNLKLAAESYVTAFMDLLRRAQQLKGDNLERILIPLGQDLFHINDKSNKTPTGGNPLDVDGRLAKIFKTVVETKCYCISEAVKIAPVDVLYSPGNHDESMTYFLCETLKGYFYACGDVNIDTEPEPRKAYMYGSTFLGFAHWMKANVAGLATVFSTHPEYGKMWGEATYREIQTGHFHKKDEIQFMPLYSDGGVVVRRLPSLAGTDFWHYLHGFTGTIRMAECYLFDKELGPAGYFPTILRAA